MAIDPSIIQGIRPVQLANPLEQYMQVQQIQQAQNQSRLADLMYGEKQQQIARASGLRDLAKGWDANTTDEQVRDSMRNNGYFDEADKYETMLQNRTKTKASAQKDQAEAQAKQFDTLTKANGLIGSAAGAIMQNPTHESAVQLVNGLRQQFGPELSTRLGLDTLEIPTDPAQLKAWAKDHYTASIDTEKQLADARAAFEGAANRKSQQQIAAGHDATTRRGQDLTDARAREQIAAGKVPAGYRAGPNGTLVAISGGPADTANKPLTEDQAKATGWLVQAENAWKNMQAVGLGKDGKPTDAAKPGRIETALSAAIPFGAGEAAANSWRSADRQKFLQGASSLSESLLRAATGAGVNKDEAMQKVRELTPVWGDSDAVIKQKMDSIPLYIESLKVRSGPGAPRAAGVLAQKPAGTPKSAPPTTNAKGWTLHTDAQGNRAYVSPDGKSYEEVK